VHDCTRGGDNLYEVMVKSFEELHQALKKYRQSNEWIFRGQGDLAWDLVPRAGRKPYLGINDYEYFTAWKRRAVEFVDYELDNEWDWLAIAQHYGLVTRLLDWTYNPLVAAYFAVKNQKKNDAVIYAYYNEQEIDLNESGPFAYKGIGRYKPKGIASRILRQSAIFTVHNPPHLSLKKTLKNNDKLESIIISNKYRKELMFELNQYGINALSLFNDLSGLSKHINWYMANCFYWNGEKNTRI